MQKETGNEERERSNFQGKRRKKEECHERRLPEMRYQDVPDFAFKKVALEDKVNNPRPLNYAVLGYLV